MFVWESGKTLTRGNRYDCCGISKRGSTICLQINIAHASPCRGQKFVQYDKNYVGHTSGISLQTMESVKRWQDIDCEKSLNPNPCRTRAEPVSRIAKSELSQENFNIYSMTLEMTQTENVRRNRHSAAIQA